MSASVKKCPECHQWSDWQVNIEDNCVHCGKPLSPSELKDREELKELEQQNKSFSINVVSIKEDDNILVVIAKRIIQAIQLSIMVIVSFILWIVTVVVG